MSRKHRSLLEAYQSINADELKETAETIKQINQGSALVKGDEPSAPRARALVIQTPNLIPPADGQTTGQPIAETEEQQNPSNAIPTPSPPAQNTGQIDERIAERNRERNSGQINGRIADDPAYLLVDSHARVLAFLIQKTSRITKLQEIVDETAVPYGTVRRALETLAKCRFISRPQRYKRGRFHGIQYTLNESLCGDFAAKRREHFTGQNGELNNGQNGERTDKRAEPPCLDDDLLGRAATSNHRQGDPELSDQELEDLFPNLHESGFRSSHLHQVAKVWKILKMNLDELYDNLEKAEWDVRENGARMEKPCVYVLSALKHGPYSAPKGFKYRRQLQAEESAKVAKELRDLADKELEDRFYVWWNGLPADEKRQVDAKIGEANKGFAMLTKDSLMKETARREFFRENIFKKG